MRINLSDNNAALPKTATYPRKDVAALFPIADKTIAQLCRENENLLIFPHSIDEADDKVGMQSVMNIRNTEDPEKVRICTGNVMGFIGIGNLHIKIKSRFDLGRDDFLLHYMLQKVLSFNLFDLNHNNEQEDVFDFIMFMFPYYLKSALRQGIFREYQNYGHNDANIRGTININRHIVWNMPFRGNVAYTTREYSCDNNMTELIRHTIEYMKTKKYGKAVLNIDRETTQNVETIIEHTPSYCKTERNSIISKNLRTKAHPYYTEYRPLQMLCLQILRMEEIKYGENDDEICGILFDGAWLWEEYVYTILEKEGFKHPNNKTGEGRIYLFEDIGDDGKSHLSGPRYPDFYKNDFVLDAKYKRLDSYVKVSEIDRNDIHQVITYMTNRKATKGGFVAPLEQKQSTVPTSHLKDSSSTLSIFGIEISETKSSYTDFCESMKTKEKDFIDSIKI